MSTSSRTGRPEGVDDPNALVISEAKNTIKALWTDSAIQEMIKRRKVRLQDCAELCVQIDLCYHPNSLNQCFFSFLGEVDWVADLGYTPSDDDVIRARLRTIGVQEHRIQLETGPEAGKEWLIYDVGGSRSMVRDSIFLFFVCA